MAPQIKFAPFQRTPWRRIPSAADFFGPSYQSTSIASGTVNWIRYSILGQYWEYSIDNTNFFRLPENPYIPDNAYFKSRGVIAPTVPSIGDCELYVRDFSGTPKLIALFSDGIEVVVATGPVASLLPSGSVAFWKLGEATGATRVDSSGTNNLTDHNSVTQVIGKIGNAAGFLTPAYLQAPNSLSLQMGSGVSCEFVGWIKLNAKTLGMLLCKDDAASSREYHIMYNDVADRFQFGACLNGTALTDLSANTLGSPSNGIWYFVDCYYDAGSGDMGISVNRGSFDIFNLGVGGIFSGSSNFFLGTFNNTTNILNATIDAVMIFKRILSTTERDNLYNSGNGRES